MSIWYIRCFDNISFIDLRNGNNQNINYFYGYGSATNNTGNNHTCIYVDNPIWSSQNWTNVDSSFSFGPNCSLCPGNYTSYKSGPTTNITACDSFNWQGLNYTSSGVYRDTILSSTGCDSIITLNLTVASSPNVQFSNDTIRICNQDSVQLDAGSGFQTYAWNTGDSTQQIYVKFIGNYNVTITTSDGCSATDSVHVDFLHTIILNEDTTICRTDSLVLNGLSYTGNYEVQNTTPTIAQMGSDIMDQVQIINLATVKQAIIL